MEVTLCDFWSYILNGYATTTWFYCDTCSGGSQIPCKKSNSPEDHTLKRPHIGALADSSRWVQPSIIPAAVPDMWVKSSWALQTGPSAGYVQLNDLSWCHKEKKLPSQTLLKVLTCRICAIQWNDCCLKPLNVGVVCYTSIITVSQAFVLMLILQEWLDHCSLHSHSIQQVDWWHVAGEPVCLYSTKHCHANHLSASNTLWVKENRNYYP